MKTDFKRGPDPQEEGEYFFFSPTFGISLVHVVYFPPEEKFGLEWEGYFGVPEWRGASANVSKHSQDCFFSEKITWRVEKNGKFYTSNDSNLLFK